MSDDVKKIGFTMVMGQVLGVHQYPFISLVKNGTNEKIHVDINPLDYCAIEDRINPYICRDVPIIMIKSLAAALSKWAKDIEEVEEND